MSDKNQEGAEPRIFVATTGDVPSWLALARSVEHLFGPMVGHGFERALALNIERRAAFCVREADRVVAGMLFDSRRAPRYEIVWLAVAEDARGRGLGAAMLRRALDLARPPCEIDVVTFGPDLAGGVPARALYQSFGFLSVGPEVNGPEGGSRERFRCTLS